MKTRMLVLCMIACEVRVFASYAWHLEFVCFTLSLIETEMGEIVSEIGLIISGIQRVRLLTNSVTLILLED